MIYTMDRENPKDRLLIFDNFQIDTNLPKYKKKEEPKDHTALNAMNALEASQNAAYVPSSSLGQGVIQVPTSSSTTMSLWGNTASTSNLVVYTGGTVITVGANGEVDRRVTEYANNGIFARLYRWFKNKKEEKKQEYEKKTVQYVFDCVLTQPEKLKMLEENNEAYEKLISNAKLLGQVALVEELEAGREVRKFENACVASSVTMALTEKQLLTFADKCEKGLKLDWIKNFTRLIPNEAVEKKKICDEAKLFDNYVVLYFDPDNKHCKLTQEEIQKKKDPILFGVMRGSRKLYFIHDWKDELCDLTMKEVADRLGSKERLTLELP